MINFKLVGALCSGKQGAICSGHLGAISSGQVGAHCPEFPVVLLSPRSTTVSSPHKTLLEAVNLSWCVGLQALFIFSCVGIVCCKK